MDKPTLILAEQPDPKETADAERLVAEAYKAIRERGGSLRAAAYAHAVMYVDLCLQLDQTPAAALKVIGELFNHMGEPPS